MRAVNFKKQINNILKKKSKIGESRHEAKKVGYDKKYIFSFKTFEVYRESCCRFAEWCYGIYKITDVKKMEPYVAEYIDELITRDYASNSISSARSALSKLYGKSMTDIKVPSVKVSEAKKGKKISKRSLKFGYERNMDIIHFALHTGCRRKELLHLIGGRNVVVWMDGKAYLKLDWTKGGRVRYARIINNDPICIKRIQETKPGEKIFKLKYDNLNIHALRGMYERMLYNLTMKEKGINPDFIEKSDAYYCRGAFKGNVFSKEAMEEVTKSLGHCRVDVLMSYSFVGEGDAFASMIEKLERDYLVTKYGNKCTDPYMPELEDCWENER